jgi:hypothetical protein
MVIKKLCISYTPFRTTATMLLEVNAGGRLDLTRRRVKGQSSDQRGRFAILGCRDSKVDEEEVLLGAPIVRVRGLTVLGAADVVSRAKGVRKVDDVGMVGVAEGGDGAPVSRYVLASHVDPVISESQGNRRGRDA